MFSGLSSLVIEDVTDQDGVIVARARTAGGPMACPRCVGRTGHVHGYYVRTGITCGRPHLPELLASRPAELETLRKVREQSAGPHPRPPAVDVSQAIAGRTTQSTGAPCTDTPSGTTCAGCAAASMACLPPAGEKRP